jgi:hypothetical protein
MSQMGYGAIAIWSIHLLAAKGRSVCGHVASGKANLSKPLDKKTIQNEREPDYALSVKKRLSEFNPLKP